MEYNYLHIEKQENKVCQVTLNRPEKLNALDLTAWEEIDDFFTAADQDDDIRVVILKGAGNKAFAAGADANSLYKKTAALCMTNAGQKALSKIELCSKPVIAAVNGFAFGGGFELALACDFRIASETVQFALPETGLGILPGAGGTQRLTRLVGIGMAKDIILLGRKIGAWEAVDIGLATYCVPQDQLIDEAEKMAEILLKKAPLALQVAKRVIQSAASSSIEVGLYTELLALSALCGTEDKKEGISAFLENRSPKYVGR